MSEIGPIINGRHVVEAVIAALKPFLGDPAEGTVGVYLAEMAADAGLSRDKYRVASYARAATFDTRFPEEALPCVVVRCSSKTNSGHEADGSISAAFSVAVGVAVGDQERDSSADVAWDYISAIEAFLAQHPSLGGFAVALELGESVQEDIELSKARTIAGGTVNFTVLVDDVLNALGGPLEPPDDPTEELPDDPQVASAPVDVQPE
jgi:hypothetical protein